MTRRTWFVWHSWIGLTAGLLLFVICWSGTVAVFSRDLDRMAGAHPSAPAAPEIAWQQVYEKAKTGFPGWTIIQVNGPPAPGAAVESWAEDGDGVLRRIYSDPASGEVIGATSYFNIQRFFRSLHMSLFIGELPVFGIPLGYLIVGLFSFPLLASGITSLIFYHRFWRGFLRLHGNRGARVFWSDLHKLTGLWSLWFVLVIGLTGVWYLVEWKTPEGPAAPQAPAAVANAQPMPVNRLVEIAERAYPGLRVKVLATYELQSGLLEVQGQDGSVLVRDRAAKAWVNAYTGEVLGVQRASELSAYQRWIETADPLHFGDFGGLISKSIWFVFGLALSGLCLTGAYLQARRQQLRRFPKHRLPIVLAYAASVAVVGLTAVYGVKELLSYDSGGGWPAITVFQAGVIGLWIASTFAALSVWMWKLR